MMQGKAHLFHRTGVKYHNEILKKVELKCAFLLSDEGDLNHAAPSHYDIKYL